MFGKGRESALKPLLDIGLLRSKTKFQAIVIQRQKWILDLSKRIICFAMGYLDEITLTYTNICDSAQ